MLSPQPLPLLLFMTFTAGTIVTTSPLHGFTTAAPSSLHATRLGADHGKEAMRLRGGSATTLEAGEVETSESAIRSPTQNIKSMLVVGAGALGGHLIEQYKASRTGARIVAMTRSKMRHEKLLKAGATSVYAQISSTYGCHANTFHGDGAGAEPVAIEDFFPEELKDDFKNIVFLVPPTQFGYLQTLTSALKKWKANKHPHSKFIFASSISVYRHSDQVIDEQSPTDPDASPNAKALLEAERLVLEEGGTVLRFAGLYSLEPGELNSSCLLSQATRAMLRLILTQRLMRLGVGSFFLRGGNLQVPGPLFAVRCL